MIESIDAANEVKILVQDCVTDCLNLLNQVRYINSLIILLEYFSIVSDDKENY